MIRFLLVLIVMVPLALVILWILSRLDRVGRSRSAADPRIPGPESGSEQKRLGNQMARLLEAAQIDPVYRQSDAWEGRARALIESWYGEETR